MTSPTDVRGRTWFRGPYFDTEEAAAFTRKPSLHAFRAWAQRAGLVPLKCGKRDLWSKAEIERQLLPAVEQRRLRSVR